MSQGPVLILVAHADDTEFFAGGTVARFVAEGREVYEVIATNNERGSFELDRETLIADSRDREAREAARILGKKEIFFLGYPDGFLGDTPLNEIREKFMRFIRRLKPTTVMTFDPWAPFEPHPDHRAVAFAAMEAAGFCHLPLYHPEHRQEGLAPHLVPELYYFAKRPANVNRVVDITPYIEKKIDALCAHDSQMKMTLDDIRLSLQATGADPGLFAMLNRDNYRPVLEMFTRGWAQKVGATQGYEYGEEFRVEGAMDLIREIMG